MITVSSTVGTIPDKENIVRDVYPAQSTATNRNCLFRAVLNLKASSSKSGLLRLKENVSASKCSWHDKKRHVNKDAVKHKPNVGHLRSKKVDRTHGENE